MIDFKILVVEHDDAMRDQLFSILKDSFHAQAVKTGHEALERIPQFNPDLILIDFQIEDMGSPQLQQAVTKKYPAIHTVMISNIDRSKVSLQSVKKRAMDYIYRSDDAERFLSDVCKLVRYIIDTKDAANNDEALLTSGFYQLAKKLYEEKKWSVAEIEKMLNERNQH